MATKQTPVLLTKEGLEELKTKLEHLKKVGRKEIALKIKEATEMGDLSENAEYDDAKNNQALMELEIVRLDGMVRNAKIIVESKSDSKNVRIGAKVTLHDTEHDIEKEYVIVGSVEADPFKGRISNESPVGKAVIGKKAGEKCEVKTPSGMITYVVKKVG